MIPNMPWIFNFFQSGAGGPGWLGLAIATHDSRRPNQGRQLDTSATTPAPTVPWIETGGNYGSMGAVVFGTRGGRDAGGRHELRRYRKSLV